MTDKERLVMLLLKAGVTWFSNNVADILLKSGVIVPPCKVGDTVYAIGKNDSFQIKKCTVESIEIYKDCNVVFVSFVCDQACIGCYFNSWKEDFFTGEYSCEGEYETGIIEFDDFGKTVFLTEKEAENKIKELTKNDC